MKIIALIMLAVFALDMVAALYFLHSWVAGVLLLFSVVAMFLLLYKKQSKTKRVGSTSRMKNGMDVFHPHQGAVV